MSGRSNVLSSLEVFRYALLSFSYNLPRAIIVLD